MPTFLRKFSEEEKTPKFVENSNTKWHGNAVPAVPIGTALLPTVSYQRVSMPGGSVSDPNERDNDIVYIYEVVHKVHIDKNALCFNQNQKSEVRG